MAIERSMSAQRQVVAYSAISALFYFLQGVNRVYPARSKYSGVRAGSAAPIPVQSRALATRRRKSSLLEKYEEDTLKC